MCKNNSRNSCKFKGCSPLQLSCNLTGKCHAIGYYSYTHRCCAIPFGHAQHRPGASRLMTCTALTELHTSWT